MQARESENVYVQRVLSDCESRIFSMAKIHEHLYQSENYLKVELAQYLQQLVNENRQSSKLYNEQIVFQSKLDPIQIETSRAINLGLIVMEILNNITKHAFSGKGSSSGNMVQVKLRKINHKAMLQISDNGSGFDPKTASRNSLGMTLIEDLSQQMDAEMKLDSSDTGTTYSFRFET